MPGGCILSCTTPVSSLVCRAVPTASQSPPASCPHPLWAAAAAAAATRPHGVHLRARPAVLHSAVDSTDGRCVTRDSNSTYHPHCVV